MLLEFGCANHKSIRDKVIFSMLAGTDQTFNEQLGEAGPYKVLRSAAIYGANGSGKSNFIEAIRFVSDMVAKGIMHQPGQAVPQVPHKLETEKTPSEYDVKFVVDGVRYAYGFSIKEYSIQNEYLYHFPNGRQARIFERKGMHVTPGSRFRKSFDVSLSALKENRLFLSCAANYSRVEEVAKAYCFFAQDLVIYNPVFNNWMEYSMTAIHQNPETKQTFLNLLRALGTGVKDVKINIKTEKLSDAFLDIKQNIPLPDMLTDVLSQRLGNGVDAQVVYESMETNLRNEESAGMKRLFEVLCPVLNILKRGRVLIWDELEANLHEAIVLQILRLFQQTQREEIAQLIFTTHDSSLLNADLFRRDQIWFTELNEHRATDLYSLAEIRDVRKNENLEKGYVNGKYGAIPMLDQSYFQRAAKSVAAM